MTPEEELAEIVSGALSYKGVPVDLPKPVAEYINALLMERHELRTDLDRLRPPIYGEGRSPLVRFEGI